MAILGIVFLAYLPALWNGFVVDDHHLVERRAELLGSGRGLVDLVSNVYWWGAGDLDVRHDLYRPLTSATWWLDYQYSRLSPFGYHLSNNLVHTANTAMVFAVLMPYAGTGTALAVAALFGTGPVAVASVGWASGRTDLWAMLFSLLFLWLFFRARVHRSRGMMALACLCLFAALASKESALFVLAVAYILDRSQRGSDRTGTQAVPTRWSDYAVLGIPLATYLVLRFAVTGALVPREGASWGMAEHAPMVAEAIMRSAAHAIVPLHYSYWSELPWSGPDGRGAEFVIVWVAFSVMMVAVATGLLRRRLWASGGAWFLLVLLPVYLTAQHWAPQSDFYSYMGLPGLWLFVVGGIGRALPVRTQSRMGTKLPVVVISAAAVSFAILTIIRLPVLRSDRTLAEHMVRLEPSSPRALEMMGEQHFEAGDGRSGAEYMRRAARISPGNLRPWMKAALFYLEQGDVTSAAPFADTLAAAGDRSPDALAVVGRYCFEAGHCDRAIEMYERALTLGTPNAYSLYDYGMAQLCVGRYGAAAQTYRAALVLRPAWPEALMNLGLALENLGRLSEAQQSYMNAVRQSPQLAPGWEALAIVSLKRGDVAGARAAADRYFRLAPPRERADNLRNLLSQTGSTAVP